MSEAAMLAAAVLEVVMSEVAVLEVVLSEAAMLEAAMLEAAEFEAAVFEVAVLDVVVGCGLEDWRFSAMKSIRRTISSFVRCIWGSSLALPIGMMVKSLHFLTPRDFSFW